MTKCWRNWKFRTLWQRRTTNMRLRLSTSTQKNKLPLNWFLRNLNWLRNLTRLNRIFQIKRRVKRKKKQPQNIKMTKRPQYLNQLLQLNTALPSSKPSRRWTRFNLRIFCWVWIPKKIDNKSLKLKSQQANLALSSFFRLTGDSW